MIDISKHVWTGVRCPASPQKVQPVAKRGEDKITHPGVYSALALGDNTTPCKNVYAEEHEDIPPEDSYFPPPGTGE